MKLQKRPDTVPEERWVALADTDGIIFSADQTWVWWCPGMNKVPTWTPSRELVLVAEQHAESFLRSYPPPVTGANVPDRYQRASAPLIVARLGSYQRQYVGIVFEGRQALFMNFFPCRTRKKNWTVEPIQSVDGGYSYFQLTYRPEDGEFVRFEVNGVA